MSDSPLDLHALLVLHDVDPNRAVLLRHGHLDDAGLRTALPGFAATRPEVYAAFQAFHREHAARTLRRKDLLVSALGIDGSSLFTGIYAIGAERQLTQAEWEALPGNAELAAVGAAGPEEMGGETSWFDVTMLPLMDDWVGRLQLSWPGGRNYVRHITPGLFTVEAIHLDSRLATVGV